MNQLITIHLVAQRGTELNWDAAEPALVAMSPEELDNAVNEACPFASDEDPIDRARDIFDDLRSVLEHPHSGVNVIDARDARIFIAGGVSYGDDPSEEFRTLSYAAAFPSVLAAIGFDIATGEHTA